jgi:integrase/recombinase XerD
MYHVDEFIRRLREEQYRFSTLKSYRRSLDRFAAYCKSRGIEEIKVVPAQLVFRYLDTLEGKDRITKAFRNHVSRLIKYFRYLEQEGLIFLSPLRNISLPKYLKRHHPVLGRSEMERILRLVRVDTPLCIKGRAIIEIAYSSALRPRELYSLKIGDVDFEQGLIFLERSKNGKDRVVPVGRRALEWTERYIDDVRPRYAKENSDGYVFINHKTGERLTVWGIRWAIQETLRRSGLSPIKTYSLRGTAATHLLVSGMNVAHISRLLGHSNVRTTQHYLDVDLKQLKREIKAKHPREKMEEDLKRREGTQ